MKNQSLNNNKGLIVLVLGLILIFTGILFLTTFLAKNTHTGLLFRGIILFVLGLICLYLELYYKKRTWFFFLAIVAIINSVILILCDTGFLSASLKNLWPLFIIVFGLALIPFSWYKNKRLRPTYFVPSIALSCFGIIFLLFSMKIIKERFAVVASTWWPILLVAFGLILILIFIWQQYNISRGTPEKAIDESPDEDNGE